MLYSFTTIHADIGQTTKYINNIPINLTIYFNLIYLSQQIRETRLLNW